MGYLPFGLVVGLKTRPLLFLHDTMTTYSNKLKSPHWQKMRLKVMQRDKFTCKLCKDTETTLNVHHKYYEQGKEPWEYPMSALVTLCQHCHEVISNGDFNGVPFDTLRCMKRVSPDKEIMLLHIDSPEGLAIATYYLIDGFYLCKGYMGYSDSGRKALLKFIGKYGKRI
jgi:hypothetical protein